MAREKTTVRILNRDLDIIETEIDSLHLTTLANYVNRKAEEVGKEQNTVDTMDLLYYTLMALAEEIFVLKEKKSDIENDSNKKIDELILRIESSLQV